MAKDPFCGMEINQAKATASKEYEGKTYYFCSTTCRDKFNASPQAYAPKSSS